MYVPDIIPKEDAEVFKKYHGSAPKRIGMGKRPAVLVVDMTNAFVLDDYPTGYSKTGVPCARAIKRLLNVARELQLPIIYTKGISFAHPDEDALRGMWLYKSSLMPKEVLEKGNEIYHEIRPEKGDIVIEKAKPSAFFGTQLLSILNFLQIDTLIVTGMVTSGCIRATVIDSFSYNYRTIIPEECVADRSQISHKVNLFDMDMKYADVMRLDDVIGELEKLTLRSVT
ncbi:MAG: isochorismatase family protein [Aigarchaeota archaeon]|nr:isochorismatase family protein [Aigarchaeota archaeon]MDW8092817.1 isochorismatase family protein [Nitrososphaerota archaeon]